MTKLTTHVQTLFRFIIFPALSPSVLWPFCPGKQVSSSGSPEDHPVLFPPFLPFLLLLQWRHLPGCVLVPLALQVQPWLGR